MIRDLRLFIEDIIENIDLIETSTNNITKEKFESDKNIIDATVRRLEIIGEAVKNIPDYFRNQYPDIPWRDIAGMRDVIIHGYFKVDLETIWKVIDEDLPELKEKISKIKERMWFVWLNL